MWRWGVKSSWPNFHHRLELGKDEYSQQLLVQTLTLLELGGKDFCTFLAIFKGFFIEKLDLFNEFLNLYEEMHAILLVGLFK